MEEEIEYSIEKLHDWSANINIYDGSFANDNFPLVKSFLQANSIDQFDINQINEVKTHFFDLNDETCSLVFDKLAYLILDHDVYERCGALFLKALSFICQQVKNIFIKDLSSKSHFAFDLLKLIQFIPEENHFSIVIILTALVYSSYDLKSNESFNSSIINVLFPHRQKINLSMLLYSFFHKPPLPTMELILCYPLFAKEVLNNECIGSKDIVIYTVLDMVKFGIEFSENEDLLNLIVTHVFHENTNVSAAVLDLLLFLESSPANLLDFLLNNYQNFSQIQRIKALKLFFRFANEWITSEKSQQIISRLIEGIKEDDQYSPFALITYFTYSSNNDNIGIDQELVEVMLRLIFDNRLTESICDFLIEIIDNLSLNQKSEEASGFYNLLSQSSLDLEELLKERSQDDEIYKKILFIQLAALNFENNTTINN